MYYTASSGKYDYIYLDDNDKYSSDSSKDDDSSELDFCYYSTYMLINDVYICADLADGYIYSEDYYTGQETYYDGYYGDYEVYSYYYGAEDYFDASYGDYYEYNDVYG